MCQEDCDKSELQLRKIGLENKFASDPKVNAHFIAKLLQAYAIGDEICTISEFNHVITGGKGYVVRIYAREGDNWKIRVAYLN